MAPPGTRLWYELKQQGRLVKVSPEMQDRLDPYTNVVPRRMTRIELIEGLAAYRLRVSEPERFLERARGFAANVIHRTSCKVKNPPSGWRNLKMLFAMGWYYAFTAHRSERRVFFRLLRENGAKRSFLMPAIFYTLVCHSMERRNAELKAEWTSDIVCRELVLPEGPPRMPRTVVIAAAVVPLREQGKRSSSRSGLGGFGEQTLPYEQELPLHVGLPGHLTLDHEQCHLPEFQEPVE